MAKVTGSKMIEVCGGCLRTMKEVRTSGCGSQRCPDNIKITQEKLEFIIENRIHRDVGQKLAVGLISAQQKVDEWKTKELNEMQPKRIEFGVDYWD